jgi:vancomycin permeability regulator SanA
VAAEAKPKSDCIIVLGAAVWRGGVASPTLERRVRHAVALYWAGVAGKLLFTGGVGEHPPSEAQVMWGIAAEAGVPKEHMLLEETASNTLESAIACAAIIRDQGWCRVTVVSDRYHLPRGVLACRALGLQARGSAPPAGRGDTSLGDWLYAHARELPALAWYLLRLSVHQLRSPGAPGQ